MRSLNLLRRLAGRNRAFLLSCTLVFLVFEFLIAGLVSTLNIESIMSDVMASLPPVFQSVLGEQLLGGMTTLGVLAFGWNHPIVLALGGAVGIVLASRAVAGEVENGAIELVLAQPISRRSYLATQAAFGLGSVALLTLGGLAGSYLGQAVFGVPFFHLRPALALACCFWLLHATSFSIALFVSVISREAGRVGAVGFLLLLASYLVSVMGHLWDRLAFLLPWSLHERFLPRQLLQTGAIPPASLAVLGGLLVVSLAAAWWRFNRRDLP